MILEHGSTLVLDERCVGHAFLLVAYVFFMPMVYVFVASVLC